MKLRFLWFAGFLCFAFFLQAQVPGDGGGSTSFIIPSLPKIFTSTTGTNSLNLDTRVMTDNVGKKSIDYSQNRAVYYGDGSTAAISWDNPSLNAASGIATCNWDTRQLTGPGRWRAVSNFAIGTTGTDITNAYSTAVTIAMTNISTLAERSTNVVLSGVRAGDAVFISAFPQAGIFPKVGVFSNDVVIVTLHNVSAATAAPTNVSYRINSIGFTP